MDSEYILPIILGAGSGLLVAITIFLLYKLWSVRSLQCSKGKTKSTASKKIPTIVHHDIPGFSIPITRKFQVQEPIKPPRTSSEPLSYDYDAEKSRFRSCENLSTGSAIEACHSNPDFTQDVLKLEPMSRLQQTKDKCRLTGSISMQDLNTCSPGARKRFSLYKDDELATLKFALYYGVASSELNVTVVSVNNIFQLTTLVDQSSICVWVKVEFSTYHQEFKTKYAYVDNPEETFFNETCVISDFPADLFNDTTILFHVLDGNTIIAEAVHQVMGLLPSFPKNEAIQLLHPGTVEISHSPKSGEILVRLRYDPVDESVTLGIVECHGLKTPSRKKKPIDTYVKIHVFFRDVVVQRFKTKIVAKSNNPSYQETFKLFGFFTRGKMSQVLVKLTIYSKSMTKQPIGYVILGTGRQNDIAASGYRHWETIIDKPELDIVQWHSLKPARAITP